MAAHKARWEFLSNRWKGLSEQHKLTFFLNSLRDEIRHPVRMLNPSSLNTAFGLAKILEEYVFGSRKTTKPVLDQGKPSRDRSKAKDPNSKYFSCSNGRKEKERIVTTYYHDGKWHVGINAIPWKTILDGGVRTPWCKEISAVRRIWG